MTAGRTAAAVGALLLLAPPASRPAQACGNVTHAWVSMDARERLPAGPLRDLLSRPGADHALRNGTMFPDGGYAIGDGYAEIAHWEPFQDRYLEWIADNFSPPWNEEAGRHIAFLLGMASHGMADQVYDATFMEFSKEVDPGWRTCREFQCAFDSSTDYLWAHFTGPQPNPEKWLPETLFPGMYAEAGHHVSAETLHRGTDQVRLAIALVNLMGADASIIEQASTDYPWTAAHMDEQARGAPRDIGPIVAAYWQVLWTRLHGGMWEDEPVIATIPQDEAYGHERDHREVGARVSVVFARGLSRHALEAASFRLVDSQGREHPFSIDLFYREASHVVNVHPEEDFGEDETYTLTVEPGITAFDGAQSAAGFSLTFHTRPPPEPEAQLPPEGCGCASSREAWLAFAALGALARRRRTPVSA